jgi:hypothetical protein
LKIKRKPKVEKREITSEERIMAIERRIHSISNNYIPNQVYEAYKNEGKKFAISLCRGLCSNGGFGSGGLMIDGTSKGVHIQISDKSKYSDKRYLIAEATIPYSEVVDYIIEQYKPKKKLKWKVK